MTRPDFNDRFPSYRKVDLPSLDKERTALREKVIGQEEAVTAFAHLYVIVKSGVRSVTPRPLDARLLVGPSKGAKTELVYALAELLADNDPEAKKKVIEIEGRDFAPERRQNLHEIFGFFPGYSRGYESDPEPNPERDLESTVSSEKSGFGNFPTQGDGLLSKQNMDKHRISYTDSRGAQKTAVLILVREPELADNRFHSKFTSILKEGRALLDDNTGSNFEDAIIFYDSSPSASQGDRKSLIDQASNSLPSNFKVLMGEPIVFNP